MKKLLEVLAKASSKVFEAKNFLYDSGLADSVSVQSAVISVGNLTFGGTGKTPVTDLLIKETSLRGLSTGVVSRNYKANSKSAQRVIASDERGPEYFGDEAFLLAQKNQDTLVYTGPLKWQTTLKLMSEHQPQVIFVDDGFQHRALYRNFDIVLLDATAPLEDYQVMPLGKGRESVDSLHRAHLVVITKANWAQPEKLTQLRALVPAHVEIVEMEFHMSLNEPIDALQRVLAVSGVASPQHFINGLKEQGEFEICEHLIFPDHHAYKNSDIEKIENVVQQFSCTKIVTTEKDFVKLIRFQEKFRAMNVDVVTVGLSVQWRSLPKGLNEYLDKIAQF